MSRQTKLPSIPKVTPDNLIESVDKIKEIVEVREGRRGTAFDRSVTVQDLLDWGLITADQV